MRAGIRLVTVLGLIALMPAAVGAAPAQTQGHLTVPLCDGNGTARMVSIPVGQQDIPGAEQPGCCAKGCQTGSPRKRGRRIDPSQ